MSSVRQDLTGTRGGDTGAAPGGADGRMGADRGAQRPLVRRAAFQADTPVELRSDTRAHGHAGAAATPASGTAWQGARNVLCLRLDSLGDVLMCTPALRALRQALPGRTLTLLTSASGAAAVPYIPELDGVMVHAVPWMKHGHGQGAASALALVRALRARAFDAAVIFTSYSQSALPAALLCQLARIPLRLAHCRENPYQLLSDWLPEPEPQRQVRHEVRRQLDLVAAVGCPARGVGLSFALRAADLAWVRRRLGRPDDARPLVLLHPGASAASRRYPAEHWAAVITLLGAGLDVDMVLVGEAGERALADNILRMAGAPLPRLQSLVGELDLGRLGAAMALAAVVVTNNSGPAHVAAALGVPQVVLYALTNPQHTPWQPAARVLYHDVPCRFCYKSECPQGHQACLAQVPPARVVAAVGELLCARPVPAGPSPAGRADLTGWATG